MTFKESIIRVFSKYATFSGRAGRNEYWYFFFFNLCVNLVFTVLERYFIPSIEYLASIYSIAVFIPILAVSVRRLHDIGKSGWYFLLNFIPIIGQVYLIIKMFQPGEPGENQYGENPNEDSSIWRK
ncbi:MAG: DUF805 domain-containing protein [Lachnospiraceae bacterium]|nr:DUF805 domain-containing protein [Lachnospiraceae bacterium]